MTNNIIDVQLHRLSQIPDHRGYFLKNFSSLQFPFFKHEKNIESFFTSSAKNVFRGFHYQTPPYECDKMITCVAGEVFDVVVDIRKESPSYLQIDTFYLKAKDPTTLFVPKGCLHGFLSLQDHSTLHYLQNANFSENHDTGFHFESFKIAWPIQGPFIISEKDLNLRKFI